MRRMAWAVLFVLLTLKNYRIPFEQFNRNGCEDTLLKPVKFLPHNWEILFVGSKAEQNKAFVILMLLSEFTLPFQAEEQP